MSSHLFSPLRTFICKEQVAKDHGTTCTTATHSNYDAATQMQFVGTGCRSRKNNVGKTEASPGQKSAQNLQSRKKYDFEAFWQGKLKGKWKAPKTRKISKNSVPQTLSQLINLWKWSFRARLPIKSESWISLLRGFFTVWSLCSVTSLLWDFFAVWRLCCVYPMLRKKKHTCRDTYSKEV